MNKRNVPLAKVYRLLESGPVTLVSTADKEITDIMPMSWHMMMEFEPPLVGCIISNRNFSFNLLKKTKECVINIPTIDIAKQAIQCGNCSGCKVDKFKKVGFTASKGTKVKAPLINECYANLECKVVDTKMVSKYNLFVLEVKKAWVDTSQKKPRTFHHLGSGSFMVAGKIVKIPSKAK